MPESPASIGSTGSGSKHYEDIVASSSALILHSRPSNLPAKSPDEDHKHRQEYQQMVEAARKKGEFPFFQLQLMVLESNR
jgi:hypothetical protein